MALLALITFAIYFNSLAGGFVFDDLPAIVENPTIRNFSPVWQPLIPPPGGSSVVGRPVINLSFALNYALSGLDVRSYHVFNVLIHTAAGLMLFAIVRRTLALPSSPEWLRSSAGPIAWCIALLWSVHPLQTESVAFIVQRTESLGGLVYLIALYGFVRAIEPAAAHGARWLGLSVAACFVGVATKEILATAPVVMLFYDRTFVAGSFREAWRQRRWFYVSAAASWLLLAFLMAQAQGRGGTVALGRGVDVWTTLLTQCNAIATYLKLSLWPHPLVVDYGDYGSDAIHALADVWPQALGLVGLGGLTIFALIKHPAIGFLGAWFFIILGPSSSFIPLISQARAEHRMYLPLAAVIVLLTVALWRFLGRTAVVVVVAVATAFGFLTVVRNRDYRSELTLWTATVADRPQNPRAHYNLGLELARAGNTAGAIRAYEESIRLQPARPASRVNLAIQLLDQNRVAEARLHAEAAVNLDPAAPRARNVFGRVLFEEGQIEAAVRELAESVRLDPENAEAHANFGIALAARGAMADAASHLQRSAALKPDADTFVTLGKMYLEMNDAPNARSSFESAIRLQPDHPMAHFQMGDWLASTGDHAAAVPHYEVAVRGMPQTIPPHYNLGIALSYLGRTQEAIACFERVLRIDPGDAAAARLIETLRTGRE